MHMGLTNLDMTLKNNARSDPGILVKISDIRYLVGWSETVKKSPVPLFVRSILITS
jgi:hypothetical protein